LQAGLTFKDWDLTVYLFNPDRDDRMQVVSVGVGF